MNPVVLFKHVNDSLRPKWEKKNTNNTTMANNSNNNDNNGRRCHQVHQQKITKKSIVHWRCLTSKEASTSQPLLATKTKSSLTSLKDLWKKRTLYLWLDERASIKPSHIHISPTQGSTAMSYRKQAPSVLFLRTKAIRTKPSHSWILNKEKASSSWAHEIPHHLRSHCTDVEDCQSRCTAPKPTSQWTLFCFKQAFTCTHTHKPIALYFPSPCFFLHILPWDTLSY